MRALALWLILSAPAAAQQVLAPEELRQVGWLALQAGDPARAFEFGTALVGRDGSDVSALVLQSQAARDLGRYGQARDAAKAAWVQATTTAEAHAAALAMAQALASDGQRMAAQFWLRRAVQTAPDSQARDRAIADFAYVRSRMPLIWRLDASVAPSSNVNNGTSAQTMEILGLPFTISGDAQALSGLEAMVGVAATWRLPPGERSATQLTFALQKQQVVLSSEAKKLAPEARGSDYAFAAYEVGLTHQWAAEGTPVIGSLGLAAGHNDYGGDPLSDYLQAELGAEIVLAPRSTAFLNLGGERQWRLDVASRSATILGLTAGIGQVLDNGDQITLSLGTQSVNSASIEIDHRGNSLSLGWEKARPIGSVGIEALLQFDTLDYSASPYSDDGRRDREVTGTLSATLLDLGYMGFNPVISLVASRNSSTVDLYDQRNLGISIGLASAF